MHLLLLLLFILKFCSITKKLITITACHLFRSKHLFTCTSSLLTCCCCNQQCRDWNETSMNLHITSALLNTTEIPHAPPYSAHADKNTLSFERGSPRAVVDKVHRSSTWVKVQIRIIKYYSSKSKSTAFSILLEWKYKSTGFFMYLSKKVLIDRFIFQFYIDYLRSFYISTYFYNPTAQNTWDFPKITTI